MLPPEYRGACADPTVNRRRGEICSRCSLGALNVAFKLVLCGVLRMAGLCSEPNTPGLSLAFSQLPVQEEEGGGGKNNPERILLWQQERSRAVQIKGCDWHRLRRGSASRIKSRAILLKRNKLLCTSERHRQWGHCCLRPFVGSNSKEMYSSRAGCSSYCCLRLSGAAEQEGS